MRLVGKESYSPLNDSLGVFSLFFPVNFPLKKKGYTPCLDVYGVSHIFSIQILF